jgi:hypothetical protein
MATPIPFAELLEMDGVQGAVRWREAVPGKGAVSRPQMLEYIGDVSKDRAQRLMAHAEAAGLAVFGISQLSYQRAPEDKSVVYPLDAYYVHSMNGSVVASINRIGVLLDNAISTDIQGLIKKMNLVDNQ